MIEATTRDLVEEVGVLSDFDGSPAEFWSQLARALGSSTESAQVQILHKNGEPSSWQPIAIWNAERTTRSEFDVDLGDLAEQCISKTSNGSLLRAFPNGKGSHFASIVDVSPSRESKHRAVAVSDLAIRESGEAERIHDKLRLAAQISRTFQWRQAARSEADRTSRIATALDLALEINTHERFLSAALAFTNGVANDFKCDRVSVGWVKNGYVRVRAIDNTEKVNQKMEAIREIERVMDEAYDQDEEIVSPAPSPNPVYVSREHDSLRKERKLSSVVTLPLRNKDSIVGALTCEWESHRVTEQEITSLRLVCDSVNPRLEYLHHSDRWIGARFFSWVRQVAGNIVGFHYTWTKLTVLAIAALIAALVFVKVPYRVEGQFILRSEEVSTISAPFQGYIERVHVRPGDQVARGEPLLEFDQSEFQLQQVSASADLLRFQREAQKARAARDHAEVNIATAQAQQAQARLDLTNYRAGLTELKAPFDCVVVEGDLLSSVGGAVQRGEALFRLARTDALYFEMSVGEEEIHEVLETRVADVAFVARPEDTFRVEEITIEPAAIQKEGKNTFTIRGKYPGSAPAWWRPGMTGVTKLPVEDRTLGWLLTHKVVDFLRLYFWW